MSWWKKRTFCRRRTHESGFEGLQSVRLTFHPFTSVGLDCFFGGCSVLCFVLSCVLGVLFGVFCLFASHVHRDLPSL